MEKEQTTIPAGMLVQVREDALAEGALHGTTNQQIVAEHGWLWIVEKYDEDDEVYMCRSVATGEGNEYWYPREINSMKKEQADG